MIGNRTSGAWRASGADAVVAAIVVAVAIAGFPGAGLPGAFGQCQYEVTAIIEAPECDILGPSPTFGQGMNNHGEVVGYYWPCAIGNDEAFYWSQDTGFITLPKPQGVVRAWAYDINDNGIIVGQHEFTGIGRKGFVYEMNKNDGEFQYLEPLHDGVVALNVSSANAINNAGVVAGARIIGKPGQSPMPSNAVIWDTNTGEVVDLGVMGVGPNSAARAISETSEVVGWTGQSSPALGFHVNGQLDSQIIPPIRGADTSTADAISNSSEVVGTSVFLSVPMSRAYVSECGQPATIIDPLPGFTSSQGVDINKLGQVLARSSTSASNIVPMLWQNGKIHSFADLVQADDGTTVTWPIALNDAAQVLTRGHYNGSNVALVHTPIDRPMTDLNGDCVADEYDLLVLLAAFGPQPGTRRSVRGSSHPADFNGDGVVNVSDLLIMLGNWGFSRP